MNSATTSIYQSEYHSYPNDLSGYGVVSTIDISQTVKDGLNTDGYINNLSLLSSTDISKNPEKDNFDFHCDINFDINFSFALPDFLSRPMPNLTLFRKADEFSAEISKLNDNLIKIFQQMGCCGISDEYNKTLVPIFRYLASSPDHDTCGDSPNLKPHDCGSAQGLMEPILQTVDTVTKMYTAVEPLFCLIQPIPGNPWLPIDFNWMAPILPYLQEFQQIMDKIMSGNLFDLVIQPVKNLNKSIENCIVSGSFRGDVLNASSKMDADTKNFIKNMAKAENEIDKMDASDDFEIHPKRLSEDVDSDVNTKRMLQITKTLKNNNVKYPVRLTDNDDVQAQKLYEIRNPGNGICHCIADMLGIRIRIFKWPKAELRVINKNDSQIASKNDLFKYINEEAYDIKYQDVNPDKIAYLNDDYITFDRNLITNQDFINLFIEYADTQGSRSHYDTSALSNDIPSPEILVKQFGIKMKEYSSSWTDSFRYVDKMDKIKAIMSDLWAEDNIGEEVVFDNMDEADDKELPSKIFRDNDKLILMIDKLNQKENKLTQKLDNIINKDRDNWLAAKRKADNLMMGNRDFARIPKDYHIHDVPVNQGILSKIGNTIKEEANKVANDSIDAYKTIVWKQAINNKCINMYNDFFGNYMGPDYRKDINDERVYLKFLSYASLNQADDHGLDLSGARSLYKIVSDYMKKRRVLVPSELPDIKPEVEKVDEYLKKNEIVSTSGFIKPESDVDGTELKNIKKNPFYSMMLENLHNTPTIQLIKNDSVKNIINNCLDSYDYFRQIKSTSEDNYLKIVLDIMWYEEHKLNIFKVLDKNIAYDFYLATYPEINCSCQDFACKLIQMVVDYIMFYVNKFIGYIMQMVLEYLIPKWLRAIIDLILYKLKCIMQIVYMEQNLTLIDTTYKNLLKSLKNRVSNYPYENCVTESIDKLLDNIEKKIKDKNKNQAISQSKAKINEEAKKELHEHHVKIDFVDIDKIPKTHDNLKNFEYYNIRVKYDIGATLKSIKLYDSTILGEGSATELIYQSSNIDDTKTQNYYVVKIPLDKIISGKLKAVVESYKSFADVKTIYDHCNFEITNFINDNTQRLLLRDYKTLDPNTFLEKDKNTLFVSFNILYLSRIGDATKNINLLGKYIDNILLFDKVPSGSEPLPSILISGERLSREAKYNEDTKLFSIIIDCSSFFPIGRNINGQLKTLPLYNSIALTADDTILCKASEEVNNSNNTNNNTNHTKDFVDTVIYSKAVKIPFTGSQTQKEKKENKLHVRQTSPLLFDCSTIPGKNGTSLNIINLNRDLRKSWIKFGLIPSE